MWASVGRRCLGARAELLRTRDRRHRGAEAAWLPDMLSGELLGAYCLSEPHAGSDPAAMTTRARREGERLRHQRREGLDDARRPRRLLQGDGPHRRRPQRHLLLPGPGRLRRPGRRPARAQDGADRLGHRDDALRRRADPRRASARRRGPGPQDRARRSRRRTARDRSGRHRSRPGRARPRGRLRQEPGDLRRAHHRPPGPRLRARRHGGSDRVRPRDDAARRPAQGPAVCRTPARPRWPSWSRPTTR